ncbi:MAG TPA: fatty acid desaturase [Acidimicrobiales bacterium]|nr:fatty acid desaturase [Acidimicrobiales bacterium]
MPIGVLVGLVSGMLTCLVTEVYCHRCLSHRAFRIHPVLGSILDGFTQVYGGVNPRRWASVHRLHHRHADTPLDPHSPLERHPLLVLVGTPYLIAKAGQRLPADASPATERPYVAVRVLITALWLLTIGPLQTLTALAVHLVCYLGIMGMVATAGHRSGSKPHPDVAGYDLAWLAVLLLGHGYHNSHHAHPAAARTGFLDPIWPVLRILSGLGLITFEEQRGATHPQTCCVASVPMAPGR